MVEIKDLFVWASIYLSSILFLSVCEDLTQIEKGRVEYLKEGNKSWLGHDCKGQASKGAQNATCV